jgi:histidinol phosphatase-like PHP family hydrolase
VIDNASIAELLMREAEEAEGHRKLAFRRAARAAFLWPEEAREMKIRGRSLTELPAVGPSIAKRIDGWLDAPPNECEPPPIRGEFMTRAQARKILAAHPEWRAQLQGDLQMHTEWSDGATSIADMANAARALDYRYIAITDHTKGLKIAGGLSEDRLAQQGREIEALNAQLRNERAHFTVLRSAELNLSVEGASDMEPTALAELDLVLGCFHSGLRRTDDQTARYLAGVRNPDIQILGHPQTRVYNHREGLQADWRRVFAEAARLDKAVEIDGDPNRQDLRISLLEIAREEGVRISLGTDAHHPDQFIYIELSLGAACEAEIPPERIINFLPLDELKKWIAGVRDGSSSR